MTHWTSLIKTTLFRPACLLVLTTLHCDRSLGQVNPTPPPVINLNSSQDAINIVTNAIDHLGGAAWKQIHSFSIHATVAQRDTTQSPEEIFFLDDWSDKRLRYYRSSSNTRHPILEGSEQESNRVATSTQARAHIGSDKATLLGVELPALVLLQILNDKHYILKTLNSRDGSLRVLVLSHSDDGRPAVPIQEWSFRKSDFLPTEMKARLSSPNVNAPPRFERFEYKHFQSISGILYPDAVSVSSATGAVRTLAFHDPELNVSYSPKSER